MRLKLKAVKLSLII